MQPNRILALWPGTTLTDPRLFAGERYLTIRQDPEMEKPGDTPVPQEPYPDALGSSRAGSAVRDEAFHKMLGANGRLSRHRLSEPSV